MPDTTINPQPKSAKVGSRVLLIVLLPVIATGFAGLVHMIGENITIRAVKEDAASTAFSWQDYFSGGFAGLDGVMRDGQLTPQQRDFITATSKVGGVFRFRLFDARGRLVVESDKAGAPTVAAALREHDAGAVRAIQDRLTFIDITQNDNVPGLPAVYAKAHVPLLAPDGELLGLVEIHVDQSHTANLFRQGLHSFTLSLAAIAAAALLGLRVLSSARNSIAARAAASTYFEEHSRAVPVVEYLPLPGATRTMQMVPEAFDDWLARTVENAAQTIPERVGLECHLGLDDCVLPFDDQLMGRVVTSLITEAANALPALSDDGRNAIILAPRIIVSTLLTARGVELSIADNRSQPADPENDVAAASRQVLQSHGGGLEVLDQPGSGATCTAWWPVTYPLAKVA